MQHDDNYQDTQIGETVTLEGDPPAAAGPAPGIGHNEPPNMAQILRANLQAANADLTDRQAELTASVAAMPDVISDAGMAGDFADQIKMITRAMKAANDRRKTVKEPYLAATRAVDGFFKNISEPLGDLKKKIQAPLHDWNVALEAEERRQRQEDERKARAEADRKERELQEREAALAAEEKRLEERRLALDRQAARQLEIDEEAQREAARKVQESKDAEERIRIEAAENKRVREARDRQRADAEERETREADQRAAQARLDQEALDNAVAAEDKVKDAARAATAKPADLSRTRGDYGAVSSLAREWVGEVVDWPGLDLETLRPFIPREAQEQALSAYVRAGNRKLAGASIFEKNITHVR